MAVSKQKKFMFGIIYSMVLVFTLCFSGLVVSSYIKEKQEFEQFKQTWQYRADTNFTQSIEVDEETGEQTVVYNISTPEQLAGMFVHSENVKADEYDINKIKYELKTTLNLDGHKWTSNDFSNGIFDGNGLVIVGLKGALVDSLDGTIKDLVLADVEISTSGNAGAVANTSSGTIKNVQIVSSSKDSYVKGTTNVGGIVGEMKGGTIENCTSQASVSGGSNMGGIVGYSSGGTITKCMNYNTGTIYPSGTSELDVGGIVGYSRATVSFCVNKQSIYSTSISKGAYFGGVVGFADGKVEKCSNYGNITGKSYKNVDVKCGGIAGHSQSTGISYCYNEGDVTANAVQSSEYKSSIPISSKEMVSCYSGTQTYYAGFGNLDCNIYSSFSYCYAGGIAGYFTGKELNHCYNVGTVKTETAGKYKRITIGYLVGYFLLNTWIDQTEILDTFVSEEYYYGGICGWNTTSSVISNCYNNNSLSKVQDPTFSFEERTGSGANVWSNSSANCSTSSNFWTFAKENKFASVTVSKDYEGYKCTYSKSSQQYTITEKYMVIHTTNLNTDPTIDDRNYKTIDTYTYDAKSSRVDCSGTYGNPNSYTLVWDYKGWSDVFNSDYTFRDLYWSTR